MIKRFLLFLFCMCAFSFLLNAQQNTIQQVRLSNGITLSGYVEQQGDGGYKVTTTEGDILCIPSRDVAVIVTG